MKNKLHLDDSAVSRYSDHIGMSDQRIAPNRKGGRSTMAKATKAVEVEDEVEEVEEAEAPAAKAAEPEVWGVRNLIALIKKRTGKEYNPREVRTLLRKLAREGAGVDREIVAGNKSRYSWSGSKDPEVLAVLKAVESGAIEKAKTEALAKLKSDKAAKTAAAQKAEPAKAKAKAKAAPAPEVDEDEDED